MSGGTLCPRARFPGGHFARGDILPSDTGMGLPCDMPCGQEDGTEQ